jgi:predicted PurR-regulated permease PerM
MPSRDRSLPADLGPQPSSQIRVVLKIILIIAAIVGGAWLLRRLEPLVFVLVLAGLFAYVIAPLVRVVERPLRVSGRSYHLSRGAAILLVYVAMAGGVAAGAALLLPVATRQVDDMVARAPAYTNAILAWQQGWSKYYTRMHIPPALRQSIDASAAAAGASVMDSVRGSGTALIGALSSVPTLILIPILAFFLLKDATSFRRTIVLTLPYRVRLRGHRLFEDLNAALAAYMRAQLLSCLLVGAVCGIGFALLGVPYPLVLGILAGALEFIPLVGPLVVAIVASIVGALHAPMLAFRVISFLALVRVIEDYVVYPRLIRRGIHLHPLAVIVAVLAGAELGGVAGMFLAVPATAIGTVAFQHWLDWRSRDAEAVRLATLEAEAADVPDPE